MKDLEQRLMQLINSLSKDVKALGVKHADLEPLSSTLPKITCDLSNLQYAMENSLVKRQESADLESALAPDTAKPIKLKILAIEQSIHSLRQQMSDKINELKLGARERDAKIVEFENKLLAIPKSQDMNFMKQHYAEINRRLDNALTEFVTKQEVVAVKAEIIDIQTLLN
jgi:hypothetical protein